MYAGFMQAITIAVGHNKDCYTQFAHTIVSQFYHVEKIFKVKQALTSLLVAIQHADMFMRTIQVN